MTGSGLAPIYAALMLHELGKEINEENLQKVFQAVGAEIDPGLIKTLVSSLEGQDIAQLIEEAKQVAVAPVAAAPAAATVQAQQTEEKKEEKKEEKEEKGAEEEVTEGLAALFG